jgi:hypothetical protein
MAAGILPTGALALTITIDPLPSGVQGLGPAIYIDSASSLDGDRVRTYTSVAGATADNVAGYLSADALDAVTVALGQSPRPSSFLVGRKAGGEDWDDAAIACAAVASFTFVCASTRTISDFMTLATWADSTVDKIVIVQNGDASWLNSGVPAGFTAHPSLAVVYHPTSTEHAAEAYAAILSAVDADIVAPAGWGTITGIDTYDLTASQAIALAGNFANGLLPLRDNGSDRNIHYGFMSGGERISAIITRAWTAIKIEAAVAALFSTYYSSGRRLPLDPRGEAAITSILTSIGAQGLAAGHYTTRAGLPDGYAFSTSIDAGTLTINVSGQYGLLDKVEAFSINLNLTRA